MKSHVDYKKYKGGMVYAFVNASDKSDAMIRFKSELDDNKLIPSEFEFLEIYENVEWENEKQEKHFEMIITETENCKDVVLDDFYMYEEI
ncbi:MAG: hypothetical protein AAFO99_02615 [Bacteroidota bacterium]